MHYTLALRVEGWHKPTEKWHVHDQRHGVRAVSRKHAINKGLKVATSLPCYTDRVDHPDWDVTAWASLKEEDIR
jgi:hypothetical protein